MLDILLSSLRVIRIEPFAIHPFIFFEYRGCLVRKVFFQTISDTSITNCHNARRELRSIHRIVDRHRGNRASYLLHDSTDTGVTRFLDEIPVSHTGI